jgi:hypothetical protein
MSNPQEPAADIPDVGGTTPRTRLNLSTSATVETARYEEMKIDDAQRHQARTQIPGLSMHANGQLPPSMTTPNVSATRSAGSKLSRAAAREKMRAEAREIEEARRQMDAEIPKIVENEKRKFAALKQSKKEATKQKMMEEARQIEEKVKQQEYAALIKELEEAYRESSDEEDEEEDFDEDEHSDVEDEQEDSDDDDDQEWEDVYNDKNVLANDIDQALFDEGSDEEEDFDEEDEEEESDDDEDQEWEDVYNDKNVLANAIDQALFDEGSDEEAVGNLDEKQPLSDEQIQKILLADARRNEQELTAPETEPMIGEEQPQAAEQLRDQLENQPRMKFMPRQTKRDAARQKLNEETSKLYQEENQQQATAGVADDLNQVDCSDGENGLDHDQTSSSVCEESSGHNEDAVRVNQLLRMDMIAVILIYLQPHSPTYSDLFGSPPHPAPVGNISIEFVEDDMEVEMEPKDKATTDADCFQFTFRRPTGGFRNVVQRDARTTAPAAVPQINTSTLVAPSSAADNKDEAMVDAASIPILGTTEAVHASNVAASSNAGDMDVETAPQPMAVTGFGDFQFTFNVATGPRIVSSKMNTHSTASTAMPIVPEANAKAQEKAVENRAERKKRKAEAKAKMAAEARAIEEARLITQPILPAITEELENEQELPPVGEQVSKKLRKADARSRMAAEARGIESARQSAPSMASHMKAGTSDSANIPQQGGADHSTVSAASNAPASSTISASSTTVDTHSKPTGSTEISAFEFTFNMPARRKVPTAETSIPAIAQAMKQAQAKSPVRQQEGIQQAQEEASKPHKAEDATSPKKTKAAAKARIAAEARAIEEARLIMHPMLPAIIEELENQQELPPVGEQASKELRQADARPRMTAEARPSDKKGGNGEAANIPQAGGVDPSTVAAASTAAGSQTISASSTTVDTASKPTGSTETSAFEFTFNMPARRKVPTAETSIPASAQAMKQARAKYPVGQQEGIHQAQEEARKAHKAEDGASRKNRKAEAKTKMAAEARAIEEARLIMHPILPEITEEFENQQELPPVGEQSSKKLKQADARPRMAADARPSDKKAGNGEIANLPQAGGVGPFTVSTASTATGSPTIFASSTTVDTESKPTGSTEISAFEFTFKMPGRRKVPSAETTSIPAGTAAIKQAREKSRAQKVGDTHQAEEEARKAHKAEDAASRRKTKAAANPRILAEARALEEARQVQEARKEQQARRAQDRGMKNKRKAADRVRSVSEHDEIADDQVDEAKRARIEPESPVTGIHPGAFPQMPTQVTPERRRVQPPRRRPARPWLFEVVFAGFWVAAIAIAWKVAMQE